MRVSINIPNHAELLCRVLDGLIEAGRLEIESGAVDPGPPEDLELVEDEDVHDPSAGEHWQLPSETAQLGGDCKDVSVWRAASLRASGEDEGATVQIWQTGRRDLHCVVLRSDGTTEDVWSALRDGTWRLGFGFSDLNPLNAIKSAASSIAGAVKPIFGGGSSVGPGSMNANMASRNLSWLRNPVTGYSSVSSVLATPSAQPTPPTPPPTTYPPGYNPYGGIPTTYGGIPTAPAYPTYSGGGGYGYPSGGGYGYPPSGDPYAGIPYYDGDEDDLEDDDEDDAQELREELAELRGEVRGQRRATRASSSSSSAQQADDGAGG